MYPCCDCCACSLARGDIRWYVHTSCIYTHGTSDVVYITSHVYHAYNMYEYMYFESLVGRTSIRLTLLCVFVCVSMFSSHLSVHGETVVCVYVLFSTSHLFVWHSGAVHYFLWWKVTSRCVADSMWYFPLLQPWVDHVPVKADLSDLEEKIRREVLFRLFLLFTCI